MKIIFFGTSNVALPVLEELIKEHKILAVVTQPDAKAGRSQAMRESPVSSLANDLKMNLLKPEKVKGNAEFFQELKKLEADIFVVVSYGKILPAEIIGLPRYKSVNIHFSALPKYRGASPIQQSILNGDEYTGISAFVLDEFPDHGPLIYQQIHKIDHNDNFFTLSDKLARASALAINPLLADYMSGKITPLPQDDGAMSMTKIISKKDGQINWSLNAVGIYNQFRAYFPWPGIWTKWDGKTLKITDCSFAAPQTEYAANGYQCGQILDGGIAACGEKSFLQIKSLQLEGKNETDIKSFLNGYKDFVGSRLG